jgi:hypothetical protein
LLNKGFLGPAALGVFFFRLPAGCVNFCFFNLVGFRSVKIAKDIIEKSAES